MHQAKAMVSKRVKLSCNSLKDDKANLYVPCLQLAEGKVKFYLAPHALLLRMQFATLEKNCILNLIKQTNWNFKLCKDFHVTHW